ncbi:uracil-DNA glycosylase [Flavobacterium sp. ACAM 123]|jgi:uracil-DNA glycosylase|uniref:uracil-DNA glycosylase n=1 Tax=Flavobacterium sp. ACAM 123 TaxID=1189620 RepID=UPI0002F662AA|nr:uracil-DNA glycosylase [Flavobacterium sp. ACAM 123]
MQLNLDSEWQTILAEEIQKPYFRELTEKLDEEYKLPICYPPKELIFAAFNYCAFKDVKVVIIGQDPYHGKGEANGLAFSVDDGVRIPPSLRNVFKEISEDIGTIFLPGSGNLELWAKQGVLLLNASLTVRQDIPNSHKNLKWNLFTDAVIKKISDGKEQVVFLLWGNFAHKKGLKIDRSKHLVLETGHPSPMSANQGKWFGNKHFSSTNSYLKANGKSEINWIFNNGSLF